MINFSIVDKGDFGFSENLLFVAVDFASKVIR